MKQRILDLLNDEIYDICDEFEQQSVAELVIALVGRLERNLATMGRVVSCELGKYIFKVCNKHGGFVSCSDTEEGMTGVSSTMYYPYYQDADDEDAGLKNLIEMVNEAFYTCTH